MYFNSNRSIVLAPSIDEALERQANVTNIKDVSQYIHSCFQLRTRAQEVEACLLEIVCLTWHHLPGSPDKTSHIHILSSAISINYSHSAYYAIFLPLIGLLFKLQALYPC